MKTFLKEHARVHGVVLVELDRDTVLVDGARDRLVILNDSAAWVWTHLDTDATVPPACAPAVAAFVGELEDMGLVVRGTAEHPVEPKGRLETEPRILAVAPLEAAAGISQGDPWAYMGGLNDGSFV